MKEIKSLRKRNEKHFLNPDGTITAYLYNNDIHYLKNGVYEEIDNTLIEQDDCLTNKRNAFKTIFPKNNNILVDLSKDNYYLKISLNNNSKLKMHKSKDQVIYSDLSNNMDFNYELKSTKLKESIILKNKNNIPKSLSFKIDTNLELSLNKNNIEAKDLNTNIFIIEAPYMYDANNNYNYNMEYKLDKINNYYLLTLDLDQEWLSNAKYPVVIDPTISNKESNVYDTYIYSGDYNDNRNSTDELRIGTSANGVTYRSLIKFDLPTIGTGCEVIDSYVYLTSHGTDYDLEKKYRDEYINVHAINTPWLEETASWNIMNNKYEGRVEDFCIAKRSDATKVLENNIWNITVNLNHTAFDITNIVKRWFSGKPNYGLLLKYANEEAFNNSKENIFYSKNNNVEETNDIKNPKPLLVVTYRNLNGLENYMTYTTQSYKDGESYVNNLTGNLTTIFNLNQTIGGSNPIELNLVYNTNDKILNNNYGLLKGYKLNVYETIKKITIEDVNYLEYLDADGTIHYFRPEYNENNEIIPNKYSDEDGLGLTAIINNDNISIIDKDTNKYIFSKNNDIYYLTKIVDTNNREINIYYDNNKIVKIVDASNNEIDLFYENNQITITSNSAMSYVNYEDNHVTSITTKKGTTNFEYNELGLLEKITDLTGLSKKYAYHEISPYKIKKVTEYGINNTVGRYLEFEYGFLFTRIKDNKGHYNNYTFNKRGNTINQNNLDQEINIDKAYGKGMVYVDEEIKDDSEILKRNKAINKLVTAVSPLRFTKNLVYKNSFEEENSIFDDSLTTEDSWLGEKSYKITNSKNFFMPYTVEGGKAYTFSGYFKNSKPLEIYIITPGALRPNWLVTDIIPVNEEFTKHSFSFQLPEYGRFIEIEISNLNNDSNSYGYLDEIELEELVSNNYNVFKNGDFKSKMEGWTYTGDSEDGLVNLAGDNKAFKFNLKPGVKKTLSKTTYIGGCAPNNDDGIGDIYYLSFWYKNTGVNKKSNLTDNHNNVGVEINFFKEDNTSECIHDKVWFDIISGNDEWQYFSAPFFSTPGCEYYAINTKFVAADNVNELYITNITISKELNLHYNFNNEETGNLDAIKNMESSKTEFKYDKNNQLISLFNPKGNNFAFEHDNNVVNRVLRGITPTGISNEIKYNEKGNPIKTIINNVNPDNEIKSGNNYHIRHKGTYRYLDCDFLNKTINLNDDDCSHDAFTIIKEGEYLRFKIGELFLTNLNNNLVLSRATTDIALFKINKNTNGSYTISPKNSDYKLYVNNNNLILSNNIEKIELSEFYFEDTNTNLFIESNAEYTNDSKFITKTTDSLGKVTTYDINQTNGLANSVTDPNGIITNYTYNNKDQITKIAKNNKEVSYTYNNQNLISKITSGTKDYNFTYDDFLNTKNISLNNNSLVTHEYEPNNGNLIKTTYGNGDYRVFNYDELDRVTSITEKNNKYSNFYNNLGNLVKVKSNQKEYTYYYDILNRTKKYIENPLTHDWMTNEFEIKYNYDKNNNITDKTYLNYDKTESIAYEYNKDDSVTKVIFDNNNLNYTYDYLGRLTSKDINNNNKVEYTYITQGNKTSTVLNTMKINNDLYKYTYDNLYNITDIYLNNDLINHYEYNNFNELIKEDNYLQNKTYKYTYDTEGNLLKKQTYTLNTTNLIHEDIYEYTNTSWEDQLTKFNNESITYDAIGNPLTIGSKTLTWINGRQLSSYTDNNLNISYTYNKDGIRNSKTINGITTNYFTEGNKIIFETTGEDMIYYIRDEEGSLIGFKYNDEVYYYIKNMQEDIIGITDDNYNLLCTYEYDSWGKVLSIKNPEGNLISDPSHIGYLNLYRYRSYYYDAEIGMYYLNSRYYNPEWGRFINADGIIGTPTDRFYNNLYSYCINNPVKNIDSRGKFAIATSWLVKVAFATIVSLAGYSATKTVTQNMYGGSMALPNTDFPTFSIDRDRIKERSKEKTWTAIKDIDINEIVPNKPCWEAQLNKSGTDVELGEKISILDSVTRVRFGKDVMCENKLSAYTVASRFPGYIDAEINHNQKQGYKYYWHYHPDRTSHIHIWYFD